MDCKIVNEPVKAAAEKISGEITRQFKEAGDTFVTSFTNAIADMKGEAKDELEAFFNSSYKDLVSSEESGLPAMVKGLGDLLEVNRTQFAATDHSIAENIKAAQGS